MLKTAHEQIRNTPWNFRPTELTLLPNCPYSRTPEGSVPSTPSARKNEVNPPHKVLYAPPARAALNARHPAPVVPASQEPEEHEHTKTTSELSFYRKLTISTYCLTIRKSQYFLQFEIQSYSKVISTNSTSTTRSTIRARTDWFVPMAPLVLRYPGLQLYRLKYLLTTVRFRGTPL